MEDFHESFLRESTAKLKNLSSSLGQNSALSAKGRANVFRVLHTIKGTSQTFGYKSAGELAHDLENLLAGANSISRQQELCLLLNEGIQILIKSLDQNDLHIPKEFSEKLEEFSPKGIPQKINDALPAIPSEILSQLSSREKSVLYSELESSRNLFVLEVAFDRAYFATGLREFRKKLEDVGLIIATLPAPATRSEIGFQILLACLGSTLQILEMARLNNAEIVFDSSLKVFAGDLEGIIARVVSHGMLIARKSDKNIRFESSTAVAELSPQKRRIIFEVLLHIVRNAVDHAIKKAGLISITLAYQNNGLLMVVSDNGCGIDPTDVRKRAIEKGLITKEDCLTEEATLDLIFRSEYSSAPVVNEISGRGVGLDAVKTVVESAEGSITVKSVVGQGTDFEIYLPN